MSRLLLGLRLARRDLRRAPLRTLLVIGLVVLPTTAMAAVVIMVSTSQWSPREYREAQVGQAEMEASWVGSFPAGPDVGTVAHLESLLPAGADVIVESTTYETVEHEERFTSFGVSDLDVAAGSSLGRFRSIDGAPPEGEGEAAISVAMARARDLSVGDVVHLEGLARDVEVTALVDPWLGPGTFGASTTDVYLGAPLVDRAEVSSAGSTFDAVLSEAGVQRPSTQFDTRLLVDLPDGMFPAAERHQMVDEAGELWDPEDIGWYLNSGPTYPAEVPGLAPAAEAGWRLWPITRQSQNVGPVLNFTYLFGSVGLAILGTIVTAAFAVGARRQLRSIGLLSCAGAPPSVLRWYLIAQGVICGALGAVLGIAIAAVGANLVPDRRLRDLVGHAVSGIDLPVGGLIPVLLIGTVVAAIAAAIPAWTAARVPTLAALAGRRPQGRVPGFVPVLGAVTVGAGCLLLFGAVGAAADSTSTGDETVAILMALGGSLLVIIGSTAMAPTLVGALEHIVKRAPGSWRLAGRSLARSRVRSSAVVAAIVAATIVLVAASTLLVSFSRPSDPLIRQNGPPPDRVVGQSLSEPQLAELAALLPGSEAVDVPTFEGTVMVSISDPEVGPRGFYATSSALGSPALATDEVLDLYEVPDDLREVIGDGGWVVTSDLDGYEARLEAMPYPGGIEPFPDGLPGEVQEPTVPPSIEMGGSFDSPLVGWSVPRVLASQEALAAAGFIVPHPERTTVLELDGPLRSEQADVLEELRSGWSEAAERAWEEQAAAGGWPEGVAAAWVELPPEPSAGLTSTQVRALVLTGVFLAVLAVVAVGLLLAGRDSRDEAAVLSAVGAPPSMIRRVGAARAVLLVAVAVVLAVPAGLLAAWSLFSSVREETSDWYWYPAFETDPQIMVFVALMAPLIGVVTWCSGLLRDAVRPSRPVEMDPWE